MHNRLQYYRIFFCFFFIWSLTGVAAVQGAETTGAFKTPISLSGTIEPAGSLKVQSSLGGRVAVINVDENENVTMGQLLLTLKNDSQKRQLVDCTKLKITFRITVKIYNQTGRRENSSRSTASCFQLTPRMGV